MQEIHNFAKEFKEQVKKIMDEEGKVSIPLPIQEFINKIVKAEEKEFGNEIISFDKSIFHRFFQRFCFFNRFFWFSYKRPTDPGSKYWSLTTIISILKGLYSFSCEHALEDESWEFYKLMMRHKQEQFRLLRRIEPSKWKQIELWIHEIFYWIFDLLSEFGTNGPRIVFSTGIIIIIFGTIFSFGELIGHTPYLPEKLIFANPWDCYYYSVVTILNLGSEVLYPAKPMGMILEVIEALLGWLLLGILISYLTKHIK